MHYDAEKMRELVLYMARAQEDDHTFGRVKLAKLLYYTDMESYVRLGHSITGATYYKRREGPAAREFVPLRDEMIAFGEAVEIDVEYPNGLVGKKLVAKRDPKLDGLFTGDELAIIDEVLAQFERWSGSRLSIHSHKEIGWASGTMDEPIPYNAYYIGRATELGGIPPLSAQQRERAEKVVAELNLEMAG